MDVDVVEVPRVGAVVVACFFPGGTVPRMRNLRAIAQCQSHAACPLVTGIHSGFRHHGFRLRLRVFCPLYRHLRRHLRRHE